MTLPVVIPNEFANATASIPLSQLDSNFSTLANVVNGISDGSETLANVSATTITVTNDATINGVTVGEGAGSVSTNTAVGASALAANTTGANNTAVGYQALDANTTGTANVAIGSEALGSNTTGYGNIAVGSRAAGFFSGTLYNNTTGILNVAFGNNSLLSNTTGNYNVGLGNFALQNNTTASNNTAIGHEALLANTTGANNTAVGYGALDACTTGFENVAVGSGAAGALTTASRNTIVGNQAGAALTTGTNNTFVGANGTSGGCGEAMTTGSKNTILGGFTGNQGGVDIRTLNNWIVLSDGDGNPRIFYNSSSGYLDGDAFIARATYASSTNMDNLKKPGLFRVDSGATNTPTVSFYAVVVFGNGDNVTTQIATKFASTETYVRSFNTAWTSWVRLDT